MGGKGKKRREKNYKEAHGVGKNRLPPPPVRSSLDVMPSKLRKLMAYTSGSGKLSMDGEENRRGGAGGGKLIENKLSSKEKSESVVSESKIEDAHEQDAFSTEKKKKKRKRKQVDDLRFVDELGAVGSKRKERKKKLLQERKMKHKKVKQDDDLDFPGHEKIKFGEVVQAPPKFFNVPKQEKLKDMRKEIDTHLTSLQPLHSWFINLLKSRAKSITQMETIGILEDQELECSLFVPWPCLANGRMSLKLILKQTVVWGGPTCHRFLLLVSKREK